MLHWLSLAPSAFIIELSLHSKPHYSNIPLDNANRTVRILWSLLSWRLQVTVYGYVDDGSRANSWVGLLMMDITTLSAAQIMQRRRLRGGLVNNEFGWELWWPIAGSNPGNRFDALRKSTKSGSQNSRCPCQESNCTYLEYKLTVLPPDPICSVPVPEKSWTSEQINLRQWAFFNA
jgi:hypothetical protein